MAVRRKLIRTCAQGVLSQCGIRSAPVDVEAIAVKLGLQVQRCPAKDDLSGFLIRDVHRHVAIIGVNQEHHSHRQRFTVAHELGHFLLNHGEQVHVDRVSHGLQIKLRNETSAQGTDTEEREANLFAAELLMPSEFIEADIAKLRSRTLLDDVAISWFADRYEVSQQALIFRLVHLGHVEA